MGRRKTKAAVVKKATAKVETTFSCPFCNHAKTVECKINKKEKTAVIRCRVCDANFGTPINDLFEPVDVYCKWIDACEKANQEESSDAKVQGVLSKRGSRYDEDEDEEVEYDRSKKLQQRSPQFVDEDGDEDDEDDVY